MKDRSEMVRVEGLADFRRDLKALGAEFPKMLRDANKSAAQLVAKAAVERAESEGGVAAHVAPSIKAAGEQLASKVVLGGPNYPMALGAEFGAIRWHQFKPWRGNQWQPDTGNVGYLVHPAIRATREEFIEVYDEAVRKVATIAFH